MRNESPKYAEMAELRPAELAQFIQDCPIVFVPTGIYEWHDEQNPLGTDTLKMIEICRRVARRTGGVIHMPSYVGVGAFHDSTGPLRHGGLNFSEEFVRKYLAGLLTELGKMGFELIVLLYGHTNPGNINAHDQAAEDYLRTADTPAKVLCVNDVEPAVRYRYKVADHAAQWETSLMMASHADRVDLSQIPDNHGEWWGLDPREHASAEAGEHMYEAIAEEVTRLVGIALNASREQLLDASRFRVPACWEDCQNMRDLRSGYWGDDERWEDPFCFYCIRRGPGVMGTLVEAKGLGWARRRLELWDQLSGAYTGRARRAFEALKDELASLEGTGQHGESEASQ